MHSLERQSDRQISIVHGVSGLDENAKLWRYMRLSTLLMLLRGKVYVPSIEDLRRIDPVEARMACKRTRAHFGSLPPAERAWLTSRGTQEERTILEHPKLETEQAARMLMMIWNRELAKRRVVWCWHQADIESMALWHVYAHVGVAVQSTPARIKESFDPTSVDIALIASVDYVEHARQEGMPHHFLRPYLLKQRCYQYEREVRVVFPFDCDERDTGRLFPVDPIALIEQIWISPAIPRSEAAEVRDMIRQMSTAEPSASQAQHGPPVHLSTAKAVFDDRLGHLDFHLHVERTGITSFGSSRLPYVMTGDFDENA